jgi:hypothetical protein
MNTIEKVKERPIKIGDRTFEIDGEKGDVKKGDLVVWTLGTPDCLWVIASVHHCHPMDGGPSAYAKPEEFKGEYYHSSWVCRKLGGWVRVEEVTQKEESCNHQ